jgi:hypothetical protein
MQEVLSLIDFVRVKKDVQEMTEKFGEGFSNTSPKKLSGVRSLNFTSSKLKGTRFALLPFTFIS